MTSDGGITERPLGRLGHLIVAMAEPHRATIVEYDRWFEAEHMYDAVLVGPGAFAANRFVAPRSLKELRTPRDGGVLGDIDTGSFVALYYLAPGTAEEHFAWSFPQNNWLGATGRNNPDRTLVLTWLCDAVGAVVRDGHRVAPQIALDHPYPGLVMVWIERPDDVALDVLADVLVAQHVPAWLAAGGPVAQVQLWSPREFPDTHGVPTTPGSVVTNPAVGRQLLALCFLDAPPSDRWSELVGGLGGLERATGGRLRLAAPFMPTVRGAGSSLQDLD